MRLRAKVALGTAAALLGFACEAGGESTDVIFVVGSTTGLKQANVRFVIDGTTTRVGLVNLPWARRRMAPQFGASVTAIPARNAPDVNAAGKRHCLACFIYKGSRQSSPVDFDGPKPGSVTCTAAF